MSFPLSPKSRLLNMGERLFMPRYVGSYFFFVWAAGRVYLQLRLPRRLRMYGGF